MSWMSEFDALKRQGVLTPELTAFLETEKAFLEAQEDRYSETKDECDRIFTPDEDEVCPKHGE